MEKKSPVAVLGYEASNMRSAISDATRHNLSKLSFCARCFPKLRSAISVTTRHNLNKFSFCARCFPKFSGGEAELFLEEAAERAAHGEAGGGGHLVDAHTGTGG